MHGSGRLLTIRGSRTQLLLRMAIQITNKQEMRHSHPQPARQPLMWANSQKSGRLGLGCCKDWKLKGYVCHKSKTQHFVTNKLKILIGEILRINVVHLQPSHGPEASGPGTIRPGDQLREAATPIPEAYLWRKSQSTTASEPTTFDHINIKFIWGPHVNHMGTPRRQPEICKKCTY